MDAVGLDLVAGGSCRRSLVQDLGHAPSSWSEAAARGFKEAVKGNARATSPYMALQETNEKENKNSPAAQPPQTTRHTPGR